MDDPIELYRRATSRAIEVMAGIRPEQLGWPTPCHEWTVQDLLNHLVGGTEYLRAALAGSQPVPADGRDTAAFAAGVAAVLEGSGAPDALERTCRSPLGFEWTVGEAVAGTFMDVLVHTWDLATATGQDTTLEPALVDACTAMFLPDMPEQGRAAGLVGPAVDVWPDASPQAHLLGAMGRQEPAVA